MTLKDEIKAEAKRLGFVFCAIAPCDPGPAHEAYVNWLETGCHAGMGYLSRPSAVEARTCPQKLLADCKTVLSLGLAYSLIGDALSLPGQVPRGRIASYALGRDYHLVMMENLQVLAHRLEVLTGRSFGWRACVDKEPLLEKAYARRQVGARIGRHSLLILPPYGSGLFLGELLLDLELPFDEDLQEGSADPCVSCGVCVRACPTGALRADRSVDARRCLSYWTIEHRGSIPEEFRVLMGARVFGCDSCQTACPENNFLTTGELVEEAFLPLLPAFAWTESEFKARFAEKSVLRVGFNGFRRNLAIALGNSRSAEALACLRAALPLEEDAVVREAIVWALGRMG